MVSLRFISCTGSWGGLSLSSYPSVSFLTIIFFRSMKLVVGFESKDSFSNKREGVPCETISGGSIIRRNRPCTSLTHGLGSKCEWESLTMLNLQHVDLDTHESRKYIVGARRRITSGSRFAKSSGWRFEGTGNAMNMMRGKFVRWFVETRTEFLLHMCGRETILHQRP